jgi:ankyrin repeat protein
MRKSSMALALIEAGAGVNTKTKAYIDGPGNNTPLHRAVWSVELTESLLKKGADPNARNSVGATPRDVAKRDNMMDVLRLLDKWTDSSTFNEKSKHGDHPNENSTPASR